MKNYWGKGAIWEIESLDQHITTVRNMAVDVDGTLIPLPFDSGRDGLWYFDGQFYHQTPPRSWIEEIE